MRNIKAITVTGLIILLITAYYLSYELIGYMRNQEAYIQAQKNEIESLEKVNENKIEFIWNDDLESLPEDGSLIVIEATDENQVYLGTLEANTKNVFTLELLKENKVKIKHSDGNHWITTKDSIQIYINNY